MSPEHDESTAPPRGANASSERNASPVTSPDRVEKQLAAEDDAVQGQGPQQMEDVGQDGGGQQSAVGHPYDGEGGVRRGHEKAEHSDRREGVEDAEEDAPKRR